MSILMNDVWAIINKSICKRLIFNGLFKFDTFSLCSVLHTNIVIRLYLILLILSGMSKISTALPSAFEWWHNCDILHCFNPWQTMLTLTMNFKILPPKYAFCGDENNHYFLQILLLSISFQIHRLKIIKILLLAALEEKPEIIRGKIIHIIISKHKQITKVKLHTKTVRTQRNLTKQYVCFLDYVKMHIHLFAICCIIMQRGGCISIYLPFLVTIY